MLLLVVNLSGSASQPFPECNRVPVEATGEAGSPEAGAPPEQTFWVCFAGAALESEMLQDTSWLSSGDESAALAWLSVVLHLKEFQRKPKLPVP